MTNPMRQVKLQVFSVFALVVDWVLSESHLRIRQDTSSSDQIETMCQSNNRTLPIDSLRDLWDSIGVEHNATDALLLHSVHSF